MNLNKEDVLQLIQEYEKQRVLWDPKDKWHFHKNKKQDAWDEIATSLNIDVEDAKKKISSLLGSFRREKAKARKTVGTGKGAKDIYKSDWFAFNSFAFLMDKDEPRQTISSEQLDDGKTAACSKINVVETEGPIHQETLEFQAPGDYIKETLETPAPGTSKRKEAIETRGNVMNETATPKSFVTPSTPKRKRAKTDEKEDPRIEKAFQFLQQPIPQDDSSMIFAKYVADRLNNFAPRTKAILMHKINQLFFDAEMEKYNTPCPSYVPVPVSTYASASPFSGSVCSPASTPSPYSNSNFASEDTQSSISYTPSKEITSQLEDYVSFTKL